jgi:hypothetical protein
MDEVVKVVGRDGKSIDDAVDVIEQRLQYRSSVVKQKSLRLVKYIAQKGSPEFRRGLLRLGQKIRELTHYTCAPDPYKGDIPWKRVQEYAREALAAVHDSGHSESTRSTISGMQGFGSGEPGILDAPPVGDSFGAAFSLGLQDLKETAFGGRSPQADFGYHHHSTFSRPQMKDNGQDVQAAGEEDSHLRVHLEQKLVDKFCSPMHSGVRVAPNAEDCRKFINSVSSKNGIEVAKALERKLENGTWQESLRALCLLEVLTGSNLNMSDTDTVIVKYFSENSHSLYRASHSAQDRVRSKSLTVMEHMGLEAAQPHEGLTTAQDGIKNTSGNLLDLDTSGTVDSNSPVENIASLLDALTGDTQEQTPNSPVAGLVCNPLELPLEESRSPEYAKTNSQNSGSAFSDPFGDWAEPSPQTSELIDPFAAMSMAPTSISSGPQNAATPSTVYKPSHVSPLIDDDDDTFFSSLGNNSAEHVSPQISLGEPKQVTTTQRTTVDALGAWHAATSGFSSSQREESAFNFVQSAMASVKKG